MITSTLNPVVFNPVSLPHQLRFSNIMTKKPASMNAMQKYGVSRTNMSYLCMNNWNFPEDFADCLSQYYLLQWEGKYFGSQLYEGTVKHRDMEYVVVYKNCTYFSAKSAKQVRLSFRKPKPEFDLPGYVIVSAFES